jgi:hypothetical protein
MATRNVKCDPLAVDRLNELMGELRREFGLRPRQEDIVSALVSNATAPQLFGVLLAYQRQMEAKAAPAAEEDEEG